MRHIWIVLYQTVLKTAETKERLYLKINVLFVCIVSDEPAMPIMLW